MGIHKTALRVVPFKRPPTIVQYFYMLFCFFRPFRAHSAIILSASSCDFQQCPWEIGSVTAERAGQGEVGGCLGSAVERSWSALGGPFPSILA